MPNRSLWLILLIGTILYLNLDFFNKWDLLIEDKLTFSSKVKNKLSLIPTSPRWKYPFSNNNASRDLSGKLDYPKSKLPIIAIDVNDASFFSYTTGIYIRGKEEWIAKQNSLKWWQFPANYKQRGKEWERKAKMSFLGFNTLIPDQSIGIRINGNATRAFPQKSLRLIFREQPIENYFFKEYPEMKFTTLLLRNGGNDWDRAFMRDVLCQKLTADMFCETQDGFAVNVYLNGEYWGIHYLRPKIDEMFLAEKYQIDKSTISIIESPLQIYRGEKEGLEDFKELIELCSAELENDSIRYAKIAQKMDIESFIDYLIVQLFIANTDWPQNNWMVWRDLSNEYNDGKWKWILKDTDYGLGFYNSMASEEDMISKIKRSKGPINILFYCLFQNDLFQNSFKTRFNSIINTNWGSSSFNLTVDSIENNLSSSMPDQINRWRTHYSIIEWENEVEKIRLFYNNRILYLKKENIISASK